MENIKHVLIIHEVEDYTIWREIFENASEIRKEAGEISYQILKYENNMNKIVLLSVWFSLEKAKAFFRSPKLIKIRADAGVKYPEFIYLDQLETRIL